MKKLASRRDVVDVRLHGNAGDILDAAQIACEAYYAHSETCIARSSWLAVVENDLAILARR